MAATRGRRGAAAPRLLLPTVLFAGQVAPSHVVTRGGRPREVGRRVKCHHSEMIIYDCNITTIHNLQFSYLSSKLNNLININTN